jgi:WD40 repeat protein
LVVQTRLDYEVELDKERRKRPAKMPLAAEETSLNADVEGQVKEIRCFTGNAGWPRRLAILPDGKRAIAADENLRLWDLSRGTTIRSFGKGGWGLGLSGDGKRVAVACSDQRVYVHEVETGKLLGTFVGHKDFLWGAVLSSDGRRLVSGGFDGLRVWDVESGKQLPAFQGANDGCRALVWSPDGKTIASGSYVADGDRWKGVLKLFDVKTGKPRWEGKGHTDFITAVAFSPDGKRLATSSFDGTVRVWSASDGKELLRLRIGAKDFIEGVAFSRDGRQIVTAGGTGDNTIRVWDLATRKEIARFVGHSAPVLAVAVTPEGKKVLSSAKDGTVRLWNMPSRRGETDRDRRK